jgi:uncharacterized protein YeaO (DUF488 family)
VIRIKRVYDRPGLEDGLRFLVDRLWPRGMGKEELPLDGWQKGVAPSDALRQWFGHDPSRWAEFQRRYHGELEASGEAWLPLLEAARAHDVTLLYSARDTEHNNAVALRLFLEEKLSKEEGNHGKNRLRGPG